VIKALLFYVIAPIAERRPPLRFGGSVEASSSDSTDHSSPVAPLQGFTQHVEVDAKSELLIRGDFLQSSPHEGKVETQWLLNARYPLASLISGMFGLTRIRSSRTVAAGIASAKDPLSEIAKIDIPNGKAVVLQPHHLVGVLQGRGHPIKITSHWRLWTLHAWLTLQFRYLMFHGPATAIVQGCRGVRIQPPDRGRSINQVATIGFTSGLS